MLKNTYQQTHRNEQLSFADELEAVLNPPETVPEQPMPSTRGGIPEPQAQPSETNKKPEPANMKAAIAVTASGAAIILSTLGVLAP